MNKRNYQKELDRVIEQNQKENRIPVLLLHSCCAPCSSYVLEYLAEYFSITVFYYNPNIYPEEEYRKRVEEQKRFISALPVKHKISFIEGEFLPREFYDAVKGLEKEPEGGARCRICFEMRLKRAMQEAKKIHADYLTTTLTISPLKNAQLLNEIGEAVSAEEEVQWLPSDFKKKNGYRRSVELSEEYGLYRQNYCGCVFSKREREENLFILDTEIKV